MQHSFGEMGSQACWTHEDIFGSDLFIWHFDFLKVFTCAHTHSYLRLIQVKRTMKMFLDFTSKRVGLLDCEIPQSLCASRRGGQ